MLLGGFERSSDNLSLSVFFFVFATFSLSCLTMGIDYVSLQAPTTQNGAYLTRLYTNSPTKRVPSTYIQVHDTSDE